jgi:uncharacterized protein YjbI with pentapeptide repeats
MKMVKTKAMEDFFEQEVQQELLLSLAELEADYQKNIDEWKTTFIGKFKKVCENIDVIQKEGTVPKAPYLVYTLLRTNILQGKDMYAVFLYDHNWYLGMKPVRVGEVEVKCVYDYWRKLQSALKESKSKYVLNVRAYDVESIIMSMLNYYHQYIVALIRYSMVDAISTEEFKLIEKADSFEILAGEYYEACDQIYKHVHEDNFENTIKEIKSYKVDEYFGRDFSGIDLTDMDLIQMCFDYSILNDSIMSNAAMLECQFVGTKFRHSKMVNADLTNSNLYGADFSDTDMTGAIFDGCRAFSGKDAFGLLESPGYIRASFAKSILKEASFKDAMLYDVVFSGADLEGADFQGAVITGSFFDKKHLEQVELTEDQRKSIKISV